MKKNRKCCECCEVLLLLKQIKKKHFFNLNKLFPIVKSIAIFL